MNTRVVLREQSAILHRPATLDDIPEATLDELARQGFEWVYLLGVWQTGPAALEISRTQPGLREEYHRTLVDFTDEDVCGSCFAITGYSAQSQLGGNEALARLRERLHHRGLRLMLDFVPNHTAPDHPWVEGHPEYYIQGNETLLNQEPYNYTQIVTTAGPRILAHGRDPFFPGWADTLQLDYSNPQTAAAMQQELLTAASQCDGLRCDMAMLLLPEIFQRTWGKTSLPFWPKAIAQIKSTSPQFVLMAEVYWDLEATLLALGFDYTYDKRLYDRLRDRQAIEVHEHLRADPSYLNHMVHFLENHDEQRAAAVFSPEVHPAAAVAAFFTPGVRFFHQGQMEGRKVKISVHLQRGPHELPDPALTRFYHDLLNALRQPLFAQGEWQLCECVDAQAHPIPAVLAYQWSLSGQETALVVVNYSSQAADGRIDLPGTRSDSGVRTVEGLQHASTGHPPLEVMENQVSIALPAWGYCVVRIA